MDRVTVSDWREILSPYMRLRTKSELEIELDVRLHGRRGTEQEHGELSQRNCEWSEDSYCDHALLRREVWKVGV